MWQVYCGQQVQASGGSPAQVNVQNMQSCMTACNNNTASGTCTGFSYVYGGAEPKDSDTTTLPGTCYFKAGNIVILNEGTAHVNVAVRVGAIGGANTATPQAVAYQSPPPAGGAAAAPAASTSPSSTAQQATGAAAAAPTTASTTATTTTSTSSTATAGSATNIAQSGGSTGSGSTSGSSGSSATQWVPAASCGSGGQYTDKYGAIWSVNCGQDNTGTTYDQAATNGQGVYACFKACDERPTCTGFSFAGSVTGKNALHDFCVMQALTMGQAQLRARVLATSGAQLAATIPTEPSMLLQT